MILLITWIMMVQIVGTVGAELLVEKDVKLQ